MLIFVGVLRKSGYPEKTLRVLMRTNRNLSKMQLCHQLENLNPGDFSEWQTSALTTAPILMLFVYNVMIIIFSYMIVSVEIWRSVFVFIFF